jgi:uncharacterized protein YodC (DUF2158 family)
MATTFKKGDTVKAQSVIPMGPVEALRMLEDGTVQYLISWVDADGASQSRWFDENALTAA